VCVVKRERAQEKGRIQGEQRANMHLNTGTTMKQHHGAWKISGWKVLYRTIEAVAHQPQRVSPKKTRFERSQEGNGRKVGEKPLSREILLSKKKKRKTLY